MQTPTVDSIETLLQEILPKPSDSQPVERFSGEAAGCSGRCASGSCRSFV